ncbi:MAG: acylphosphatase [Candidatus Aenigmarchaeota archaeon]|nr:acylphosphatase [Candidatus Aenigmarchaeota archaeon]
MRVFVKIYGRVQAVGFRAAIFDQAINSGIRGFVRNVQDGTVEMLLDGEEALVQNLIQYCRKGPDNADVDNVEISEEDPKDLFTDFRIL